MAASEFRKLLQFKVFVKRLRFYQNGPLEMPGSFAETVYAIDMNIPPVPHGDGNDTLSNNEKYFQPITYFNLSSLLDPSPKIGNSNAEFRVNLPMRTNKVGIILFFTS
jgi:hypothetical protein